MITCTTCQQAFEDFSDEQQFRKKMVFQYGSKSFDFPAPTQCPDCRNQIRTAHRNERFLYHRNSDLSGKSLIALYSPDSPWGKDYKVYSQEEWNSDLWDPMTYGVDFDFSRPFFEQYEELHRAVPKIALITLGNENCPYTTGTGYCKNCHLINSSEYSEDCYYGKLFQKCKNSVDCTYLYDCELCYECFSVYNSYNCAYLSFSQNCSDCWFSENLTGSKNCFLSTNLINKEYYFMNQPLGKEEYQRRIKEFLGSHRNFEKAKQIFKKMRQDRIHKYANVVNSENCSGDFIKNSRNCINCYDVNDSEDSRNVWVGVQVKDVYDSSNMYVKPELNYQILGTIEGYHIAFGKYVFHSSNVLYSEQIFHSQELFGCIGLRKKKYCIFNKQYSKDEYEALVPKIIEHMQKTGEWGQFFPVKNSPHGYNESLAMEYYPLKKEEVLARGWHWQDDTSTASYQGPEVEIPDHIDDVSDEIVDKILMCETSDKPYKIMKQELVFYRQMKLPIPRRSPDQRYDDRLSLRNPRKLWERSCMKCSKPIQSTYDPKSPEKVYCEECYLKEVY